MKVSVRTPAGRELTTASLVPGVSGLVFRLQDVPRSNGLLAYYFGKGGRRVVVEVDGERMYEAELSTQYERNARTWSLVLPTMMDRTEERQAPEEMALAS